MKETAEIEIRRLEESDISEAMWLKESVNWNQTETDWLRLLRLEPTGCFCATIDGAVVATTTTTTYGKELAWIGMVLVDPERRRLGIATKLMHGALDYLSNAGVTTIKLDATPVGRSVYEALGFKVESLVERWEGIPGARPFACSTLNSSTLEEVLKFDRHAFDVDRSKLIELLIEDSFVPPCFTTGTDGRVTGYALARRGSAAAYVGPLLALGSDAAANLLDGLLSQMAGRRVYIDLNMNFEEGQKILIERGWVKQRELLRMSYGKKTMTGCSPSIFAIAGPETG